MDSLSVMDDGRWDPSDETTSEQLLFGLGYNNQNEKYEKIKMIVKIGKT